MGHHGTPWDTFFVFPDCLTTVLQGIPYLSALHNHVGQTFLSATIFEEKSVTTKMPLIT